MNPDDLWKTLEADASALAPGQVVARRIYPDSVLDIRVAVESPANCRMLLTFMEPRHILAMLSFRLLAALRHNGYPCPLIFPGRSRSQLN